MKKKMKVTENSKQKSIIDSALNSSDKEQLDLYKSIFGGRRANGSGSVMNDCAVVAVSGLRSRSSAYDKSDQFLLAAI
jgi:hypothetical protein